MARLPERYTPDVAPQDVGDLARYTERELHRLAASIEGEKENTVIALGSGTSEVTFGPSSVWEQIFIGYDDINRYPDVAWNASEGAFVAQLPGLYRCSLQLFSQNPGGTGQQAYSIGAGVSIGAASPPTVRARQGAPDNMPSAIYVELSEVLDAGEQITFWGDLIHSNFVQVTTVTGSLSCMLIR